LQTTTDASKSNKTTYRSAAATRLESTNKSSVATITPASTITFIKIGKNEEKSEKRQNIHQ
jgi:hypothetical protein